MKPKDFDKKFDQDKKVIIDAHYMDTAHRVNQVHKRINVECHSCEVESLNSEAARINLTRQSIINV